MERGYRGLLLTAVLWAALSAAAMAQDKPGDPPAAKPAPQAVWPAGLQQIAGKYVFVQVASPGGFWDRTIGNDGVSLAPRQVSLNEVPSALKDQLTHAELTIADLKLPTMDAEERTSPSGRGKLRFYEEHAVGRLTMKGLPGIGGAQGDTGEYSGPVTFGLDHQSHSNPTVSGVLKLRMEEESTWGVAVMDHASLSAVAPPAKGEEEGKDVIANARILRSGVEIFAFTEWVYKDAAGEHHIHGSVRLIRGDVLNTAPPPGNPAKPPARAKA
jgi:hypothetical protein